MVFSFPEKNQDAEKIERNYAFIIARNMNCDKNNLQIKINGQTYANWLPDSNSKRIIKQDQKSCRRCEMVRWIASSAMIFFIALSILAVQTGRADTPPSNSGKDIFSCSGMNSHVTSQKSVIIHDQKAFADLWKEHNGDSDVPVPQIDFSKYDVVAVFAGTKPTGGYCVEIGSVVKKGKDTLVQVKLMKPAPGMMTIQMVTHPFAMKAVPKLADGAKVDLKETSK
jgi:hypothetical protein